jgi:predicted DNA-binding transcriptional regulator AlpA
MATPYNRWLGRALAASGVTLFGESEANNKKGEMMERLLHERELAEHLYTPVPTLRYWRSIGAGPRYVKAGKRILYRESDIEAWLAERANETK